MEIEISEESTGEVVDRFTAVYSPDEPWSATVQQTTLDRTPPQEVWEASLPFRSVSAVGLTQEEAIGGLVRAYADMARRGCFNPHQPHAKGSPVIQHVLGVLTEHLHALVEHRGCFSAADADGDPEHVGSPGPEVLRRSEAIAAVATAIAALGRVKGL